MLSQQAVQASVLGLLAPALLGGASYSFDSYNKARNLEQIANGHMQEAINQVGMMVAAREAAMRKSGQRDALAQVEREISSLGGSVPGSREEAQQRLKKIQDKGEILADLQQRLTEKRDAAQAVGNRVNGKMGAVEALRNERQRLEDQCKNEDWDDYDAKLRSDRITIQDRQNEIASRAGQEGLSIPSFDASVAPSASAAEPFTTVDDLEMAGGGALPATERESDSLDGKRGPITDLTAKLKRQQALL